MIGRLLFAACFRHTNYHTPFLLLRDVSCPEHLFDDITQVVTDDYQIVRVEFEDHPIIHVFLFPSFHLYGLVLLRWLKGRLEQSSNEVSRSKRTTSVIISCWFRQHLLYHTFSVHKVCGFALWHGRCLVNICGIGG